MFGKLSKTRQIIENNKAEIIFIASIAVIGIWGAHHSRRMNEISIPKYIADDLRRGKVVMIDTDRNFDMLLALVPKE